MIARIAERLRPRRGPTWVGIYGALEDVPREGPGFDGGEWMAGAKRRAMRLRTSGPTLEELEDSKGLAMLIASIASRQRLVRVLDFGGGLGFSYLALRSGLAPGIAVDYAVVETAATCTEGEALLEGDVTFLRAVPGAPDTFDVVYVSSALQYVSNWAATLRYLAELNPRFLLLHHLSAGDIPTFATTQLNVRGSAIPYWFLNATEVEGVLQAAGYQSRWRARCRALPDQRNFPGDHRLTYTLDWLFVLDCGHAAVGQGPTTS